MKRKYDLKREWQSTRSKGRKNKKRRSVHDSITMLVFAVAAICLVMTLIAAAASAQDNELPQPQAISSSAVTFDDPVQAAIARQLDAIRMRDAETAFSFVSPDLHKKFETAAKFLGHMRFEQRPLYNHENYSFLEKHDVKGALIQKVVLEDRDSRPVTVLFRLEQEPETGQWLIDSFTVLQAETSPI